MTMIRTLAIALCAVGGAATAQSVTLTGLDGHSRVVTAAELAAMPRAAVDLKRENGGVTHYEGVPMVALLQSVGAPTGKTLRGPELADIVVVSAKDGYRVALALSDLDPGFTPRAVILADKADGAPIAATDGPLRLVVEGDLRAARSARMVTALTLERAP